jgi:hypothetical protein
LLRDEQFGFRPRHSPTLQLAHLVERVNRTFDERRLTGEGFLDVAKPFDAVWIKGLQYKLTVLNMTFLVVKTISSYLDCRTFQTSFQSATCICRCMWAGVAQGTLVCPVLFSLYVNNIPTPSCHVEFVQYADDRTLVATSCSPSILVGYLEAYLGRLKRWLRDQRLAINISNSIAVLSVVAERRIQKSRAVQFLGEPIQCVETARYLEVTLDTQLNLSSHVNQVGKKAVQRLGPLL